MKKRIAVGLSGGVDSSVAAYLLKKQGYDVVGVTMDIWNNSENFIIEGGCLGEQAKEDARKVAEFLGIPYLLVDFRKEFKEKIMDYFASSYAKGETPNPCTRCNRLVKWEALFKGAGELGADYVATGHYAKIKLLANGRYSIANSKTAKKDQTYALCNLTQEQLKRTVLPIGEYEKEEVRELAREAGFLLANKPDSQEICFIPDGDYAKYLETYYGMYAEKGSFVDIYGKELGEHKGIIHYTVGQRKGLGMTFGKPMYVKKIEPEKKRVVLSSNEELFEKRVVADEINFMAETREEIEKGDKTYLTKIRYNHGGGLSHLSFQGDRLVVDFIEPQRAPAPGQTLVVYSEEGDVVCGGKIVG